MVDWIVVDLALEVLFAYGGWRLWHVHRERLGFVILIVAASSIPVAVFAALFVL